MKIKFLQIAVRRRAGRGYAVAALVAVTHLGVGASAAEAQGPAIAGVVVDSAGIPISGAEVGIDGSGLAVRTNDRGEFRFPRSPMPPFAVRARRLGFASVSLQITPTATDLASIRLRMLPIAHLLPSVSIVPDGITYTGRLAEYYTRLERRSAGVFITRNEIDRSNARSLSFLLERVPGVQLTRGRVGSTVMRMRGRRCRPLVWIDGVAMPSADVDINSFPPNSLHGIEIYFGLATAPARYIGLRDGATCGTLLLWSRGPDTEFPPEELTSAGDLEKVVNGMAVFTAENVDSAAKPDTDRVMRVPYPPPLFAERVSGRVVAEFVVTPEGRVEPHTIVIVSSTHPLFSRAVRTTLQVAAYVPATKSGRNVSQLVHQAFDFNPVKARDQKKGGISRGKG